MKLFTSFITLYLLFFSLFTFTSEAKRVTATNGFQVINVGVIGMTLCDSQDVEITIQNISIETIDSFTINVNCQGQAITSRTYINEPVLSGATFVDTLTLATVAGVSCNVTTNVSSICDGTIINSVPNMSTITILRPQAEFILISNSSSIDTISNAQSITYSLTFRNMGTDSARNSIANASFDALGNTTLSGVPITYNGLIFPPNIAPGDTLRVEWVGMVSECPLIFNDWSFQMSYQINCLIGNTTNISIESDDLFINQVFTITNYLVDDVNLMETSNVGEICISITDNLNIEQTNPRLVFDCVLPNWLLWNRITLPQIRLNSGVNIDADSTSYNAETGRFIFFTDYPDNVSLSNSQICIGGLVPDCLDSTDHSNEDFFIRDLNVIPNSTTPNCNYPIILDVEGNLSRSFLNRLNAEDFDFTICNPAPSTQISHEAFRLNIGDFPIGCSPDSFLLVRNDTFRTVTAMRIETDGNQEAYSAIFFREGNIFNTGNFVNSRDFLEPRIFNLEIKDSSSGTSYFCTNIQYNDIEFSGTSTQSGYEFILHVDSLLGNGCALPIGFTFDEGDTVILTIDYLVLRNEDLPLSHLQTIYATNLNLPYFNNFTILNGPNIINFELVQAPITPPGTSRQLCDNRYYGSTFFVRWNGGLLPDNPFGCERRNIFSYDRIDIDRLTIDPFVLDSLIVELDGDMQNFSIAGDGSLGLRTLFENGIFDSADIIGNDLILTGTFPYNCAASFIEPINWGYLTTTTGILNLNGVTDDFESTLTQTLNTNYPANLDINTSSLEYGQEQFFWNLRIVNPVLNSYNTDATQFWLDIATDNRITIDSIVDISSPAGCGIGRLTADLTTYYPINIGDCGLGGVKEYRVYGSANACFDSQMTANIRFRCNAMEDILTGTIARDNQDPLAPCVIDSISQNISTGSILTITDIRTADIVDFCDEPLIELNVENISQSISNNVIIRLPLNNGFGIGNNVTFTPTGFTTLGILPLTRAVNDPAGGIRTISGAGVDTLIIYLDSILTDIGVNGIEAGATLRVGIETFLNCDFISGNNLEGSLEYFQFCMPTSSNQVIFETREVYLRDYESNLFINVQETPACSGTFEVRTEVQTQGLFNGGTTNITDSLSITLPLGVTYVPMSASAAWGEPNIVGRELIWGIPPETYTIFTIATNILEFMTQAGQNASELCQTHVYDAESYITQNMTCPGSGLFCPDGRLSLDTAQNIIAINRPTLELNNLCITNIDQTGQTIQVTLNNISSLDQTGYNVNLSSGSTGIDIADIGEVIQSMDSFHLTTNLTTLLDELSNTGTLTATLDRTNTLNCLCQTSTAVYNFNFTVDTAIVCLDNTTIIGQPFNNPGGNSNFTWIDFEGVCCLSDRNIPNPTIQPDRSGTYTLYRITESSVTGKILAIHRQVIQSPDVEANIIQDTINICQGTTVTVSDNKFILPTPESYADFSYQWFINGTLQPATDTLFSLTRTFAILNSPFEIIIEKTDDFSGCIDRDTVLVVVNMMPNINLGNDTIICTNDNLLLYPGPFQTYLWQDGSSDTAFTVTNPGSYYVTVGSQEGCEDTDTIEVFFNDIPTVEILFGTDTVIDALTFCDDEGQQLLRTSVSSPLVNYIWYRDGVIIPGATADTLVVFNPSASNLYTVQITDLNLPNTRCTVLDTARVIFNPLPIFTLADTFLGCLPASLITSPLAGVLDITHMWIDPADDTTMNESITPTLEGYYTLMTTNTASGCTYMDSAYVIVHVPPVAQIQVNPLGNCIGNLTFLSANTAGHTPNVRYEWTDETGVLIGILSSIQVNIEQMYRLVVIDDSTTCSDTAFYNLTYNPLPIIQGIPANVIFCLPSTVLGDQLPLNQNYLWLRGMDTISVNRLAEITQDGNYFLRVTDPITGCFSELNFIASSMIQPIINLPDDTTLCETETLRLSAFDPGHSVTTQYTWRRINDNQIIDNDAILDLEFCYTWRLYLLFV